MKVLTISPQELRDGVSMKDMELMIAKKLQAAGFEFEAFNPLIGQYQLKRPHSREPNPDKSVTYRQWDPLPQKGSPI